MSPAVIDESGHTVAVGAVFPRRQAEQGGDLPAALNSKPLPHIATKAVAVVGYTPDSSTHVGSLHGLADRRGVGHVVFAADACGTGQRTSGRSAARRHLGIEVDDALEISEQTAI
jgi:hypothetical protein